MISRFYRFSAILRSNETAKCPLLCTSELSSGMAFKTHRYQTPTIVVMLLNFTVKSVIPGGRLLQCPCTESVFLFPQKPVFLHKIVHQKQVNYPPYRIPHPRPTTNSPASAAQAVTIISQMSPHRSMNPFQAVLQ